MSRLFIPLLTLLSLNLLFSASPAHANWLSIGVLNEKGKPAGCMLVSENKQATIQILYSSKMKLGKINFKSKVQSNKQKKVPFRALKVKKTLIQFNKADKNTPKKIVILFKKGRNATLVTKTGEKVAVSLIGFSRALKNCRLMMKGQ